MKLSDTERQLLQHIADSCNEASDTNEEKDGTLTTILCKCDELADSINEYLETE